jgi:peptidyl-tRNA hydrolase
MGEQYRTDISCIVTLRIITKVREIFWDRLYSKCKLFQVIKNWERSSCPKVVVKAPDEDTL